MSLPHPHLPAIPRPPVVPPLWREGRIGLEWAALRRSSVLRGAGVPAGDGRGVLLIPGFLAGDGSLATMTQLAARRRLAHQAGRHPRQRRLLGGWRAGAWRSGWRRWRPAPASAS